MATGNVHLPTDDRQALLLHFAIFSWAYFGNSANYLYFIISTSHEIGWDDIFEMRQVEALTLNSFNQ